MISTRSPSLQDLFLNAVRRSKVPVSIFLTKGVRLQGMIASFDNFALELRGPGGPQLIYKHAVSTIVPVRAPEGFIAAEVKPPVGDALQDLVLANAAIVSAEMHLYFLNGVMLEGHVGGFDQYCVLLTRAEVPQLVYKHAISTLRPH
ncbi:MAG: RNA chaperone Hfq, partial [Sphingomicrobium sp.]